MKKYLLPLYLLFIFVTAIIFDYLFLFNELGISVFIFVFLLLIFHEIIRYIYLGKLSFNRYHILSLPIVLFSLVFFLRANTYVLSLAGFSLLILLPLYFVLVNNKGYFNKYSGLEMIEMWLKMIVAPFIDSFLYLIKPFFQLIRKNREEKKNKNKISFKISIALIISLPIFYIVLLLLASADEIFAQFIDKVIPDFSINSIFTFIFALILSFVAWFYLSGFVASKLLNKTESDFKIIDRIFNDNLIPAIVINLLNILYIIFSVIQFGYLFGGEEFVKKQGIVFSEYAIKGFWEMIFVVLINFVVLSFLQTRFSLKSKISRFILISSYFVTIFASFVMVYSSHVRLAVYEGGYGFSENRLIPHTFLIFVAAILLLLLINIFLKDENRRRFINIGTVLAVIFYLIGFCSFNMESFIIKKNIEKYNKGESIIELDMEYLLQDLGIEGLKTLLELRDDEILNKYFEAQNNGQWFDGNIYCRNRYYQTFQDWNEDLKWFSYNYQRNGLKKAYSDSDISNLEIDNAECGTFSGIYNNKYLEKEEIKYPASNYEGIDELFENEKYKVKITQEYLKADLDQKYLLMLDSNSKKFIEEKKNERVNFGGKYLAIYWDCGTECFSGSLINLEDGKMYTLPTAQRGIKFNEESLIYIVDPLDEDKVENNKHRPEYAYPKYYYFNEEKEEFELLHDMKEAIEKEIALENNWEGHYEYEEVKINKDEREGDINSSKTLDYSVDIFSDHGGLLAYIDIEGNIGSYINKEFKCLAKEENGQLNFYFLEYREEHNRDPEYEIAAYSHSEGDLLFSFIGSSDDFQTEWGKLYPQFEGYAEKEYYFKKVN